MTDTAVRLPEMHCPQCLHRLDAAKDMSSLERSVPSPGDLTVCAYCATVLVFGTEFSLRVMTTDEINTLTPEHAMQLLIVQRVVTTVLAQRKALLN